MTRYWTGGYIDGTDWKWSGTGEMISYSHWNGAQPNATSTIESLMKVINARNEQAQKQARQQQQRGRRSADPYPLPYGQRQRQQQQQRQRMPSFKDAYMVYGWIESTLDWLSYPEAGDEQFLICEINLNQEEEAAEEVEYEYEYE